MTPIVKISVGLELILFWVICITESERFSMPVPRPDIFKAEIQADGERPRVRWEMPQSTI